MMLQSANKFIKNIWVKLKYIFTNPHFFVCFFLAWMITNGWAYVCLYVSTKINCSWLFYISSTYLAFLWLTFTPEKLITIPIATFFVKLLYPNDLETLKMLNNNT